jgi:CRISPR-associated protein Cas4
MYNFAKTDTETIRVSALHALAYCPRLFYLEEVEELYTQDAAVFAGRRLHSELEKQEEEEWEDLYLVSEEIGLRGRVDALRTRDGQTIPYEHKRGRCHRDEKKQPTAWESDRLQILAYCYLIESALGIKITEGRIRYHADNILVHIPFDDEGKKLVENAIVTARQIRTSIYRPPVTDNERLCSRCSLSPVCLPEEARLAHNQEWQPIRLFPKDDDRQILHILEPALGFYHQPRSQAAPLALDLMEIFRVPLVDMPIVASVNRQQWDVETDFEIRGEQVWLNESGRRKLVELYERRKEETWKHPVTGYSLTYRRLLELEVRLLEKEWMGEGGLFGQLILR